MSETVQYDQSYCYSVIENRIRPFDWYQNCNLE